MGVCRFKHCDCEGSVFWRRQKRATLKANSARMIDVVNPQALSSKPRRTEFLSADFDSDGKSISQDVHFLGAKKDMSFPECDLNLRVQAGDQDNNFLLRLSTNNYARLVQIRSDGHAPELSDNYFDLQPGQETIVSATLHGDERPSMVVEAFRAHSMNSIAAPEQCPPR